MPHGTHLSPQDIPPCFYRISAKALVLDETLTKFLIIQAEDGRWGLPGGGIEHGEMPTATIRRELKEEMGLEVINVAEQPAYFITFISVPGYWLGNVLYKTTLRDLNFSPSNECIALQFVSSDEVAKLNTFPDVVQFAQMFNLKRHR